MNFADISGLAGKELTKKTKELREQMFEARMKNSLGQLANPMTIRNMRRDIARLKTALATKAAPAAAVEKKAAKPAAKKAAAPKKAAAKGKKA